MNISSNILQRTFQIKCGENVGTCFTIDVQGKQYIITAWHLVNSIENEFHKVEIMQEDSWKLFDVRLIGHGGSKKNDISVLAPATRQLSPIHKLKLDYQCFLTEDAYFLGFPHGCKTEMGSSNNNFPIPWVKRGIISGFDFEPGHIIYLDGHNNKGFSGGPVVCIDKKDMAIIGVVSGYLSTSEDVYEDNPEGKGEPKKIGLKYQHNIGIVVVRDIKLALDMINQNPNGFTLLSKP